MIISSKALPILKLKAINYDKLLLVLVSKD